MPNPASNKEKTVKCPSCDSTNVQRVQMAYEMGTQSIQTSSTGTVQGSNRKVSISGSGTQQTQLARRLSPPRQRSLNYAAGLTLLAMFMVLIGMNLAAGDAKHMTTASVAAAPQKQKKKADKTDATPAVQTATASAAEPSSLFATFIHPLVLSGVVAGAIGVAWSLRNRRWNRRQWPLLFAEWQRRWVCHQCGTVFAP